MGVDIHQGSTKQKSPETGALLTSVALLKFKTYLGQGRNGLTAKHSSRSSSLSCTSLARTRPAIPSVVPSAAIPRDKSRMVFEPPPFWGAAAGAAAGGAAGDASAKRAT